MGRQHQADGVIFDMGRHRNLPHQVLPFQHRRSIEHPFDLGAPALGRARQNFGQLRAARIGDEQLEEKTVQLPAGGSG